MLDYKKILNKVFDALNKDRYRNDKKKKVSFGDYCKLKDNQRQYSGDEDIIVTPVLLDILKVLGYESGVNIIQQVEKSGDKPDFRTIKTNLFILDAKTTNIDITNKGTSAKTPVSQITRYLSTLKGYEYGILFNLTKFEFFQRFYSDDGSIKVKLLNDKTLNLFKLIDLKEKDELEGAKEYDNFKWFLDTFIFREISREEYIEIIKNRSIEELVVPDKEFLREIIYNLINQIRREVKRQVDNFDKASDEKLRLEHELVNIARELNIAEGENEEEIALNEFVNHASYVVLLKIVLIRILEDNNLIEKNLYNGGFKSKLEPPLNFTLHKILYDAKYEASNFYPYFYDGSPFDFQIEDDNLFIEVLFELSKINFAEINFDLIGDLYEHYLNLDDRKEKGQYYTPHFIVEFILNRVGWSLQKSKELIPKSFLDPACGSGGFLVEIAKRYRLAGNNKEVDAKRIIADQIYGIEITPFASFLTEINIIIQILPLVKRIENKKQQKISSLKIFRQDSLFSIYNRSEFNGGEEVKINKTHVLAGDKELKFGELINKNDFDFVIGNPPYVGEKGHKELFEPLKDHEYWKHFYQGKSDYLYYFIILGLSKLKERGRFGFVTTQYWLTADGASNLRRYILEKTKIIEIIDFKGIKLFPEAKGQENIVFILEKCDNEEERMNNNIRMIEFKKEWVLDEKKYVDSSGNLITNYDRWVELLKHPTQFELFANVDKKDFILGKDKRDQIADVYYSSRAQGELDENAWYLYSKEKEKLEYESLPTLPDIFNVNQGIISGADRVTNKNIQKLNRNVIDKNNIQVNDPIFILNKDEVSSIVKNASELLFMKSFYKNSDIQKGFIDFSEELYVIYSQEINDLESCENIQTHLSKYKDILEDRREVIEEKIRWFDLWWARDKEIFENEKLVTSRRSDRNRFAYENLNKYPQSDITIITKKEETKENLKYLLALLNSKLLDDWYGKNTKLKGDMREYYFTPLSKVPIKQIDFNNKDEVKVHNILGGVYSPVETKSKGYKYDLVSNTWIKEKGLIDYYMEIKKELYELKHSGFLFNPENSLASKNEIEVNFFDLCSNDISKNVKKEYFEDLSLFESLFSKGKDIDKFSSIEKEEVKRLLKECEFYIKSNTKDFVIKGIASESSDSLFPDDTEFAKYGFKFLLSLKTKENGIIEIEAKELYRAQELVERINFLLRENKYLSWDQLKSIPFSNPQLKTLIEDKTSFIYEALKPVDKSVEKRLEEIFEKDETQTFDKIKNLNYLQTLVDYYVEWLYNTEK